MNPSLIVSIVAVVIASAGSATAATVITGKQIRNGSVTGRDIKNRSISRADLKPGTIDKRKLSAATISQLTATPASATTATADVEASTGYATDVVASCPAGQVAVGGGAAFVDKPTVGLVVGSEPVIDASGAPVGWKTTMRKNLNATDPAPQSPNTIRGYAICSP